MCFPPVANSYMLHLNMPPGMEVWDFWTACPVIPHSGSSTWLTHILQTSTCGSPRRKGLQGLAWPSSTLPACLSPGAIWELSFLNRKPADWSPTLWFFIFKWDGIRLYLKGKAIRKPWLSSGGPPNRELPFVKEDVCNVSSGSCLSMPKGRAGLCQFVQQGWMKSKPSSSQ